MTTSRKILWVVTLIVAFLLGGLVGHLWNDIPLIRWNPELKIYEVLNLILIFSIGIFVPFFIKRWIEDSRSVKSCLIDELRSAMRVSDEIRTIIDRCQAGSSISQSDKDQISYLFHRSEQMIDSFDVQMKVSFPHAISTTVREVKEAHHAYQNKLTGGELMTGSFTTVTGDFRRGHETACSNYQTKLKVAIQQVHRF
jgi:hypothetical protein